MGMFPFSLLFVECRSSANTGPGPAGDARRQMRSLLSRCLLSLSPGIQVELDEMEMRKPVLAVSDPFTAADAKHVKHPRLFLWSISGIYSRESGPDRPVRDTGGGALPGWH